MLINRLRVHARPVCAALAMLMTIAPTARAMTDCDLNIYQAYETAKSRGWGFKCFWNLPGGSATLLPFGASIGCAVNTPPVAWSPLPGFNPMMLFFNKASGLRNGWSLKTLEITGAQWTQLSQSQVPIYDNVSLIRAGLKELKPAKKYSVVVSRMTLTKSGGTCSNAINEAF